jgi:hypothetical protein
MAARNHARRVLQAGARAESGATPECCLVLLLTCLLTLPPSLPRLRSPARQDRPANDEIHQLWSRAIDPMLQAKLHSSDQAYTDGQELLVPLHAAFAVRDDAWELSFSEAFSRLAADPSVLPNVVLSRFEYLYLASEFLALAERSGRADLIPPGLPELLFSEVHNFWQVAPAWQWGRSPFPGGIRERILWKLKTRHVEKNYYRAFVDDDLFLFAIAADLKAFGATSEQGPAWNPMLGDILSLAFQVFSQKGVFQPGGGWLFQPGVWADHPDYQYAGNVRAQPGIRPAPLGGIAADSSHSMRFAAWLTSLMLAYPADSPEYRFYARLRTALEKQFFGKVLLTPTADQPCYLLNNFMDGSNGVYRWNYESLGIGKGYGPNQLSGSLLLGWWALLATERTRHLYADLAGRFTWPAQCINFYLGPTSVAVEPLGAYAPDSPILRFWHASVLLASRL